MLAAAALIVLILVLVIVFNEGIAPMTAQTTVVVSSNPYGKIVLVDGKYVTTPQTFSWEIGSTHTLEANPSSLPCGAFGTPGIPPAGANPTCMYLFVAWSDGGAEEHTITTPSSPTTYTAAYQTQYLLSINYPSWGGNVTVVPAAALNSTQTGGWYNAGQVVTITATAYYAFSGWSGPYTGTNQTITIKMNSAINETANFSAPPSGPWLRLKPTSGPDGTAVAFYGSLLPGDTGCYISSQPKVIWTSPSSCKLVSIASFSGTFTISGNAPTGTYTIIITGSSGDGASATFTVTSTYQPYPPSP
jgi:hypothetical protein